MNQMEEALIKAGIVNKEEVKEKHEEQKRREKIKKDLIQKEKALDIQSASNISGIIFSFADIMKRICKERQKHNYGTDWVNKHPIVRMFAIQIVFLTDKVNYDKAYSICEKKSNKRG